MNRRSLAILVPLLLLGAVAARPLLAGKGYSVQTTVKDGVTTKWTISTPDGKYDLTRLTLTEAGTEALVTKLTEIEAENGVDCSSRIVVQDGRVVSDELRGKTTLDENQARELSGIIADGTTTPAPCATSMAGVHTDMVDGQITDYWVDFGDGRIIDLAHSGLDPTALEALVDALDKFEQQNGVQVASETKVKGGKLDKDRVRTFSRLTPAQIEELIEILESFGIRVERDKTIYHTDCVLQIKAGNDKLKTQASGELVIQTTPLPESDWRAIVYGFSVEGTTSSGGATVESNHTLTEVGSIHRENGGKPWIQANFRTWVDTGYFDPHATYHPFSSAAVDINARFAIPPVKDAKAGTVKTPLQPAMDMKAKKKGRTPRLILKKIVLRMPGRVFYRHVQ